MPITIGPGWTLGGGWAAGEVAVAPLITPTVEYLVVAGGGGQERAGNGYGGSGGSGIVIIRYPDSYPAATATTGSPTITVAGGYRIYKWTTVGNGSITF